MYSVFPTGVTHYEPERAHNSYVLFDGRDGQTHLIDMNGNDVHTWDYIGFPSHLLDPAVAGGQHGHVLVQLSGKSTPGPILFNNLFNNKEIGELDWDGNVVWKWGERAPGGAANQSHDWHMTGRLFQVTPAGNIMQEYVNSYFARAIVGGREILTNWTYRAQPVPYDWVPPQTPRAERPVHAPDVTQFRVPAGI